jgi:hypothetical protein
MEVYYSYYFAKTKAWSANFGSTSLNRRTASLLTVAG